MSHMKKEGQMPAGVVAWDKVRKEVKKLGGTITGGLVGKWYRFNIEAPDGTVWNCTGDTHTLAVEWRSGDAAYKQEAAIDALERVRMGVSSADSAEED